MGPRDGRYYYHALNRACTLSHPTHPIPPHPTAPTASPRSVLWWHILVRRAFLLSSCTSGHALVVFVAVSHKAKRASSCSTMMAHIVMDALRFQTLTLTLTGAGDAAVRTRVAAVAGAAGAARTTAITLDTPERPRTLLAVAQMMPWTPCERR